MIRCSRCKKRPAVIFITSMQGNEKKNEGFCLTCAKQLNIPQISEYMKQLGISDAELDQFSDQMMELMDGDSFEMGGSGVMPNFFQDMMRSVQNLQSSDADNEEPQLPSDMENEDGEEPPLNPAELLFGRKRGERSKDGDKSRKRKKELKFLDNYCTNLSKRAEAGELDNIIGRDKEIARVVQILSRRTKNNPCLIGEPGVGKTAIAEGIAQRIQAGNVPFNLKNKQVYLLDLTALVAGTQFRGQFESRIKGLVNEVKQEGNIILFIDELHNLVGTGSADGTMNAANILKPALSRGEVQVIGATTFEEYRKYIEKDAALERRFQPVTVNEPTIEETVEVLEGIKKYYEKFHRVHVSKHIVRLCAKLSERYITDRFLPDKAIDLLDESCACTCLRSPEITKYDAAIAEQLELLEQEKAIEEEIDIDYEKLAAIKGELIRVKDKIEKLAAELEQVQVTEADLAKVIELWTGIPANKIEETEFSKIAHLEESLSKRIIGQESAVHLLANAIKRTRVQLSVRRRPASFIFVGPTGVGKTELVKVLSETMFDSTEPLIRLDMTEFMEKHSVARMIGSPPGYVGYDEAGQLTEKVRRKPYSVILFDEIEKAHPDVMNILMQILDEGKIDDAQGRTVSFENTIICMTSNAGSTDKSVGVGFNRTADEVSKERAMKALREFLRPEFISRIDEIIVFNSLSVENFAKIAALMLDEMKEPLAEKNISLTYDEAALKVIAELSYGKPYGARDIRRVIREKIEDPIANIIIENSGIVSSLHITINNENKLIVQQG